MKKSRKALIAIGAVAAAIAVGLATTTVVNVVATTAEAEAIEPYGQSVEVAGKSMNVLVTGEGEDLVLLPGFGTSSPVLDFAPLIEDLAADHRLIVVEPFGYGLSDATEDARTTANIVSEVHEALQALGVTSYTLMGHSIAGLYGIEFAERYPDEVHGFVGIDSSVPGQPNMDVAFPTGLLGALKGLGLVRLLSGVGGDGGYASPYYDDHERQQIGLLTQRNSLEPTYLDEMARIRTNFADAEGRTFPADLPLLLFVQHVNPANDDWLPMHERQAATVTDGTVIPLDGDHYLHHTQSPAIAQEFRAWEAQHSSR
ncbi:alpha/beta fold hydrolase [Microbacterium nymphoidis]|uniref:alpha/beta fold hydrolase n=1 Tax=Microbacterium nymphoidis TaxID=2898586 RepID=UPI001E4D2DBC|nr:alpha/beta hydrolase [Microbacterium nymphoidis]MCD2497013.1 alpha/beta hydrolase [Microbacterium nymphoidis]